MKSVNVISNPQTKTWGFPGGPDGKESSCNAGRPGFHPWVGKIPWRRAWQPTPVFLPGESHGQRSLAGYSPWGRKESDATEQLTLRPTYLPKCNQKLLLSLENMVSGENSWTPLFSKSKSYKTQRLRALLLRSPKESKSAL